MDWEDIHPLWKSMGICTHHKSSSCYEQAMLSGYKEYSQEDSIWRCGSTHQSWWIYRIVPEHLHGWNKGWSGSAGALQIRHVSARNLEFITAVNSMIPAHLAPRAWTNELNITVQMRILYTVSVSSDTVSRYCGKGDECRERIEAVSYRSIRPRLPPTPSKTTWDTLHNGPNLQILPLSDAIVYAIQPLR